MSVDQVETARRLLVTVAGADAVGSAPSIGAAARVLWSQLAERFARLIGDAGIRTLQERTWIECTATLPWLVIESPGARDGPTLGVVLATRPPAEALAGVAALVTSLITLLARFIGGALVGHVLHELWSDVFPAVAKEPA